MTVHLCHQGRQLGAFSEEQVEAMLKAGVINDGTLAWTSGMAEWKALSEVLQQVAPPPVPPQQTAGTTVFGLTPGFSNPTDHTPKKGLPSPLAVPPVIVAGLSESVRREILKELKVGSGQRIAWFFFILGFAGGSAYGGANWLAGGLILCCGPIVLRSWCKRCTLRLILRRDNLLHVYWPALWSFGWRNACVSAVVAFVFSCPRESALEKGYTIDFVLIYWLLVSLFALNIPRRYRRWVEWMIATDRAKTMPPTQSKNQDESGPVAVARGGPSSLRKILLSTGSTKWVIGLSLVFAVISIIAVACAGVYVLRHKNMNQSAVETGGQDSTLPSNGQGVPKDDVEAVKRYRKAAEQNYAPAQNNLGVCYRDGQGVAKDYVQAYKWYNLAAAQGNTSASNNRDRIAGSMTPDQIAEGQRLSAKSGQTLAENSNSNPPLERLGNLFPSISQYGNPQYVVSWKNFDPTAKVDDLFEFVDYPATTGFIAPPTDITVPVYPPGIGAVVKPVSPMARCGQTSDCILYITDIRPGACVVWVGSTNADYAPELLCADYAVLAACGIADENDHEYKYLEICDGGAWRHSPSTGGSLAYLPVLFYKDKPTTDARIQSVQEIKSRATKDTVTLATFLKDCAESARHSKSDSALP